jgi:hypothetical protein
MEADGSVAGGARLDGGRSGSGGGGMVRVIAASGIAVGVDIRVVLVNRVNHGMVGVLAVAAVVETEA